MVGGYVGANYGNATCEDNFQITPSPRSRASASRRASRHCRNVSFSSKSC